MSDNIIVKIRKLRAKAEDPSCTEEEALAFAEKVQQLLAAHDLEQADLYEDEKEPMEQDHWETMYLDPWRRRLIREIARLYFCDTYLQTWWDREAKKSRDGIVLVGRGHNILIARETAEYLIGTTLRLASAYASVPRAGVSRRAAQIAFERGCGERLAYRVHLMREAQSGGEKQRNDRNNPSNLPALYEDESKLLEKYMSTLGLRRVGRRASDLSTVHSGAGIRAANQVNLGPQVTHTPGKSIR